MISICSTLTTCPTNSKVSNTRKKSSMNDVDEVRFTHNVSLQQNIELYPVTFSCKSEYFISKLRIKNKLYRYYPSPNFMYPILSNKSYMEHFHSDRCY
jgi:hypothetical protein